MLFVQSYLWVLGVSANMLHHQTRAAVATSQVALDGLRHMFNTQSKPIVQTPPSHDLHFDSDLSDLEDDAEVIQLGV
jgi:hypothetical protein